MLTDEQKIDTLYKYKNLDKLSKKQIQQVMSWANDKNALVRVEVGECLFQEYPETTKVLLRLGKDKDWFVRITAYTTLRVHYSKKVELFLKKAMNKEHHVTPIVNAISSWSVVAAERGENLDKKLKYIKKYEKNEESEDPVAADRNVAQQGIYWEKKVYLMKYLNRYIILARMLDI